MSAADATPSGHLSAADTVERIELLRLRDSNDEVAKVLALGFSQILRRLDDIAAGLKTKS